MKKKRKISCLLLAALMLFALAACGKDSRSRAQRRKERSRQSHLRSRRLNQRYIHPLWDLSYDEADGWVYEEDDFMMMKILQDHSGDS